mmetsp:Transcript_42417/g.76031  ORF Transcript_42417/g.76031 Transcript_42417/m.76031 type:complete len:105 (-) Transcript_42417:988-1302(-)
MLPPTVHSLLQMHHHLYPQYLLSSPPSTECSPTCNAKMSCDDNSQIRLQLMNVSQPVCANHLPGQSTTATYINHLILHMRHLLAAAFALLFDVTNMFLSCHVII